MDIDELWENFLKIIKNKISSLSYQTWFCDTKLVSIRNNTAIIVVPMPVHKKHLMDTFIESMEEGFKDLTGTVFDFNFMLNEEWEKYKNEIPSNDENVENTKEEKIIQNNIEISPKTFEDANLNKDYNFNNFIVGNSNRFAFTASMAVAEKPGKAYNPLFLYGKSGLGKTHLMHSIGNYILEHTNLRVLYISSDKFVNDFINAVRNNDKSNFMKIDNFKAKYRNIDVLMIDDIQFLGNATKGQEEFFHTFNELYNENKQIIIASDRSVDDLKMLENRLLTRFNWGLTANITPPDFELRMNILERKIAHQESAKDVPKEVIEYIANNFASDVRQLEGAITRVFAYALMMNKGIIDLDTAIDALKDQLTDRSVYKNDVNRIQTVVCDYFKITLDDIKGKKRSQNINYPRQVAIYLCRVLANESFPKIGTYFGGRDHSTIMSAYQKIQKELLVNEQLKVVIKDLKQQLSP